MTLKQKKLAKAYLETGSVTKAGVAAGYSPATAAYSASRALKAVKPELNRMMDRMGLSEEKLLDPIRNGLVARSVFRGKETKAPDHSNRLKSTELAWKLRGHLRATPEDDDRPRPILILASAGSTVTVQPSLTVNGNGNGNGHSPHT
mgnify:CR=1 FL=1